MENKYYTPEIEEFHEGFEYEKLILGTRWNKEIWDVISSFDYSGLYDFDVKDYRVKYLDREDIESLGFEFSKKDSLGALRSTYISDPDSIVGRILDQKDGSTTCWHMKINCFENSIVKIECQMSDANEYTFFEGIIKNKSELKRILKQIGYNDK